jgi:hypothetical protein
MNCNLKRSGALPAASEQLAEDGRLLEEWEHDIKNARKRAVMLWWCKSTLSNDDGSGGWGARVGDQMAGRSIVVGSAKTGRQASFVEFVGKAAWSITRSTEMK